jgi:hypothetical protein
MKSFFSLDLFGLHLFGFAGVKVPGQGFYESALKNGALLCR